MWFFGDGFRSEDSVPEDYSGIFTGPWFCSVSKGLRQAVSVDEGLVEGALVNLTKQNGMLPLW
jgi:hypothetical protein